MRLRRFTDGDSAIREIGTVLAVWIKGRFVIWLSVTALYLVGFSMVQAPLWPLLAILCGLADAIPHVGSLLALLLVLIFTLPAFGTWTVGAALCVWVLVQIVESFVIGPRVLGRKLGLNPWLVLLGGIAGGLVAGPIGILIATPLLAVGATLWRRRRRKTAIKY